MITYKCCNAYHFIVFIFICRLFNTLRAEEPVVVPATNVPQPQPIVIGNPLPESQQQVPSQEYRPVDRSGQHPPVPPSIKIGQPSPPPPQYQQETVIPGVVHAEDGSVVEPISVQPGVIHPEITNNENSNPEIHQGPIPELDLSDDEYRKLHEHEHQHLFNENHEDHLDDTYSDEDDEEDGIVDEWSEHMDDFIPDMLVTFRLPSRTDEYFYQEVGNEATLIRGGYFIGGDKSSGPVQFTILDPTGEVAVSRKKSEGLFHFMSKMAGTYTFVIANTHWVGEKYVTFVIGAGNHTTLSVEHVNSAIDNLMTVAVMIRDISGESQYLWARQKSQMQTVQSSHSRAFWLSLLELTTICLMTGIQIYLIKGLVSNRRIF